jgi:DNA-binding IclR family transcriptional regulator
MSRTAHRTLDLLELVARSESAHGLIEIAEEAGLDKSTTARLLAVLEQRNLLQRDAETRKYSTGPRLIWLGMLAANRSDLRRVAEPFLAELRDETEETVSLHIRVGDDRVCIAGAESRHDVRRVLTLGEPVPLWLGPTGKIILAFLPSDERDGVLTRVDHSDLPALRSELTDIRAAGFVDADGGRTRGVGAISVPIIGSRGVEASMTAAGPSDRWDVASRRDARERVLQCAREISVGLGGPQA